MPNNLPPVEVLVEPRAHRLWIMVNRLKEARLARQEAQRQELHKTAAGNRKTRRSQQKKQRAATRNSGNKAR